MKLLRTSLLWKLILAFLMVALTSTALVFVLVRATTETRFNQLIFDQMRGDLKTTLVDYYTKNGSWDGVAENWQKLQANSRPAQQQNSNQHPGPPPPQFFGLADAQGKMVVGVGSDYPVSTQVSINVLENGTAVEVDGKVVGTILTSPQAPKFTPEEARFLERTNEALLYSAGGALVVSLVMGVFLAGTLIKPLRALTRAAQNIAEGDLMQQVKVGSRDEIGQLALTFNTMSAEVARSNQLRRQMTADIAHDLRTPLTVIAGYIESMQDGVLKPTPERLEIIHTEIERLQNLVNDLRTLSLADAGELSLNPQEINPKNILERASLIYQHRAQQQKLTLRVEAGDDLPQIRVDEARMMQVLGNLLSNALRYTPEGGEIVLAAKPAGEGVELQVRDTGSGIAPEDLPHIFERSYRADKSRYTSTRETGLGLAIAKALIEAQGGTIGAESNPGAGTAIRIQFLKPAVFPEGTVKPPRPTA